MYNKRTKRKLDRRILRPSVSQLSSTIRYAQQNVIGPNKITSVLGNLTRRQLFTAAEVHKAYVKTTPGVVETVACYLDTDNTGEEITVTCSIIGGSALNSAVPRLADGELIFVSSIGGTWYCLTTFQASEDCDCYEEP